MLYKFTYLFICINFTVICTNITLIFALNFILYFRLSFSACEVLPSSDVGDAIHIFTVIVIVVLKGRISCLPFGPCIISITCLMSVCCVMVTGDGDKRDVSTEDS